MNKKIFKYFICLLTVFASSVLFVALSNDQNKKNNTLVQKLGSENHYLDKIEKRTFIPTFEASVNDSGEVVYKEKKRNYYQVKLLLKYSINDNGSDIKKDAEEYSKKNKFFLSLLIINLKEAVSHSFSRLTPYVWINFNNQKFKDENLISISKNDFVSKVYSYEEKEEVTEPETVPASTYCHKCVDYFSGESLFEILELINFNIQKRKENEKLNTINIYWNKHNRKNGIGILESGMGIVNHKVETFQGKKVIIYDDTNQIERNHSSLVAGIAAGKNGVDRHAEIFSAGFQNYDSDWIRKIEWMILDSNVRVINHSYSLGYAQRNLGYSWTSMYLDYIARKYGVVNVISSGNGYNKIRSSDTDLIAGSHLSFNSLVVGSLSHFEGIVKASYYSNRETLPEYSDLPKPFISTYGDKIRIKGANNPSDMDGDTSYAAALVSGAVSVLLRVRPYLFDDETRVTAIKAVLASSAKKSPYYKANKSNGFSSTIGAGSLDFERMIEATKNLETVTVDSSKEGTVLESEWAYLHSSSVINAASAWSFNAGLVFGGPKLDFEETVKRQNGRWFSDYDMILERRDDDTNTWTTIERMSVVKSNVELMRHRVVKPGWHRIRIIKYNGAHFKNSYEDNLSVAFVVDHI